MDTWAPHEGHGRARHNDIINAVRENSLNYMKDQPNSPHPEIKPCCYPACPAEATLYTISRLKLINLMYVIAGEQEGAVRGGLSSLVCQATDTVGESGKIYWLLLDISLLAFLPCPPHGLDN